jgi:tRNA(Ile)-lysidine synthase
MAPALDSFERHVLRFLVDRELAAHKRPLLIGVSGGPDSISLLAASIAVRDRIGVQLHVTHVDHGLRGTASRGDADYVRRLSKKFDVPITIISGDVRRYRNPPRRVSVEVAARQARYAAFAVVAREQKAAAVLVAHTADDQIETVLMNLMRGAGLRGTAAMQPVAPLPRTPGAPDPPFIPLARPLLDVPRADVKRYLRLRRLRPRLDESNSDPRHLRNRVRNELVPLMETIRSGSSRSLLRASSTAADAEEALNTLADRTWRETASVETAPDGRTAVVLEPDQLMSVAIPKLTRTMIYARALEAVAGTREGFGSRHIDAIEGLIHSRSGSLDLPYSVLVTRSQGSLTLSSRSTAARVPTTKQRAVPFDPATHVSETSIISP